MHCCRCPRGGGCHRARTRNALAHRMETFKARHEWPCPFALPQFLTSADVTSAYGERSLNMNEDDIERLLLTLDVAVEATAVCAVERGVRLVLQPKSFIEVHYVLNGT